MADSPFEFFKGTETEESSEMDENHVMEIGIKGLKKQILQPGVSWKTPYPGDEVEVHYSGLVEGGQCFDSSRDRNIPFRFKLGQCEVIKGWDEGIATMKKGERSIFTIPPNLAYGEEGYPPLIPSHSTLIFDIELLSWISIRDLTGDGGILKKIVREGEGWSTPKDPDQVLVKYEVRHENGKLVSKSEEGVEFYISDGYLCPAIGKAARTMRKREKAELSVKFSYGIEQAANEATSSNLIIDLELLSWKSVINITEDKKVVKKIIKDGEGFDHPDEGSLVRVMYISRDKDGKVIETKGSEADPYEFSCFEEPIHEGLFRSILTMRKGERSIVTINSDTGTAPANDILFYELELLSFSKEMAYWKMTNTEKVLGSEKKKDEGNKLFKAGKFWCASVKYEKAVKCVEFDHSFTDEENRSSNALRIACNLNNAACKLKLGEYIEASKLCTKVLELDPDNVKALFRRSKAYIETTELEKAETDIERALAIQPNNREVKLEYEKLKNIQKQYAKYEAEIFGTMFTKLDQLQIGRDNKFTLSNQFKSASS